MRETEEEVGENKNNNTNNKKKKKKKSVFSPSVMMSPALKEISVSSSPLHAYSALYTPRATSFTGGATSLGLVVAEGGTGRASGSDDVGVVLVGETRGDVDDDVAGCAPDVTDEGSGGGGPAGGLDMDSRRADAVLIPLMLTLEGREGVCGSDRVEDCRSAGAEASTAGTTECDCCGW